MARLDALFERLDPDPSRRGRQFEDVCEWYLTHDPAYRRILRRVWLWGEWPGNDGRDIGIDLVAEDRAGQLWAIQSKAYDPGYAITKRDRWTTEAVDGAVPAHLHRSWSLNRKMAGVFGSKARMRGWGVLDDASRKKQFQVILSADDLDQFVFNPKGMADLLGTEFPRRFEPSPAILAEREVVPCTSKVRVSQVKYRPVVKRTNPLVSALKF